VNLASVASLAVAELDLQLVQSLVGAIRAADAAALAGGYSALSPHPALPVRSFTDPEPQVGWQSRERAHRSPCCYERPRRFPCDCEPKPMLHALPRLALTAAKEDEGLSGCGSTSRREKASPIQPPWEVRAWQEPVKPPTRIKVIQYRTDILSKGSLIDMFI
jgi:hypothetical protein